MDLKKKSWFVSRLVFWKLIIAVPAAVLIITAAGSADSKSAPAAKADSNQIKKVQPKINSAIENWQDLRFGLFIHWGPVSLKGTEIGWSRGKEVPTAEYDNLYKQFKAEKFNAADWVGIAKKAGAKYIVITSKHHDGFCMWDSKYTDYDIMATPFGRDCVAELAAECKKESIKFGVYYSICDWHHPDYPSDSPGGQGEKQNHNIARYMVYLKNQLKEILTKYEPVNILWFDGHWEDCWPNEYGDQLYKFVKQIQPDIVVNNRISRAGQQAEGRSFVGDYDTPEQEIGQFDPNRPWESCITLGTQWSWKPNDELKTGYECIETLVRTCGNNGNLLLNVGPMPNGQIEPRQAERLAEIGNWLKTYGESIFGTRGGPYLPGSWGVSTYKGDRIYLHILDWQAGKKLVLPAIDKKITSYKLLTGGDVKVEQSKDGITIQVAITLDFQKTPDTIIALELDGPAGK
jgi:alpha-L-fucosidase